MMQQPGKQGVFDGLDYITPRFREPDKNRAWSICQGHLFAVWFYRCDLPEDSRSSGMVLIRLERVNGQRATKTAG